MTCQDKVFASTDISIPIEYAGVLTSDIAELSVKFVNSDDPSINKTYLKSTDGIVIVDDTITVLVSKNDITTPGKYDIYIKRRNLAGKELGVVACPASVYFYPML